MRVHRRIADLVLVAGSISLVASVPLLWRFRTPSTELPWILGMALFVGAAAYTWIRRRGDGAAWWFAVGAGAAAITQGIDSLLAMALIRGASAETIAWTTFAYHMVLVLTVGAMAHLFGLFPSGRPHTRAERALLRLVWVFFVFPPLVVLARPTSLFPTYLTETEVPNPYAIEVLAPVGQIAGALTSWIQTVFGVGVILLALRYRRADTQTRRRIRWLLLPGGVALFSVLIDVLFPVAPAVMTLLFVATMILVPLTITIALVRPSVLDVDLVLRKSLVYGSLWLVIAAAYVAAAAGLGVAAGQRFSVGMAITLTVVATLVFQPARQWLERVADRWVFGVRADPTRLVTRLGAALEETVELERLLPRMESTLEDGLGLRWVRVRLVSEPVPDDEPALVVPIILDDEQLGVVECGPKISGVLTSDDEAVVTTLARQAALAVRNVRLTAELEQSRARLVRAQDAERRRIERNIHDGVQQDLVALIAHAGHTRGLLDRDPVSVDGALSELQDGLHRVNAELRELAHGIHPSVLSDRGLLEAVEALAARSSVPVSVRADPALRELRFAEEVEGAGYFTVAEALANVSKHAAASHAEVRLARSNGVLHITVQDDGEGIGMRSAAGEGLANLAERLAALGGRLNIESAAGQGTTVTAQLQVSGG